MTLREIENGSAMRSPTAKDGKMFILCGCRVKISYQSRSSIAELRNFNRGTPTLKSKCLAECEDFFGKFLFICRNGENEVLLFNMALA